MRTTACILAFLIAGMANAAEPSRAVHKKGSCKPAANVSESHIDFRAIEQRKQESTTAISMGESTNDFCCLYKVIRWYTDATYTTQCGSRFYYCDGLVGTAGICNPPSPYYIVEWRCECSEESCPET